jgi:hypothetical protein
VIADYGDFRFTVKKNKVGGSPEATGTVRYRLLASGKKRVGDGEDVKQVMDLSRELGLIYAGDTGKEKLVFKSPYSMTGKYAFAKVTECEDFLRDNVTIFMRLRSDLMTAIFESATGFKLPEAEGSDAPDTGYVDIQADFNKPKPKPAMKIAGLDDKLKGEPDAAIPVTGLKAPKVSAAPKKPAEPVAVSEKEKVKKELQDAELTAEEADALADFIGDVDEAITESE